MRESTLEAFDRRIEAAVLRQLTERESRLLYLFLAAGAAVALSLSLLYPTCAAMLLFLPALLTSFFLGLRWGLVADLLALAAFHQIDPTHEAGICFAGLCLFGTAISGNTTRKYREAWRQRDNLEHHLESARQVQRFLEPPPLVRHGPCRVATSIEVCQHLGGDLVGLRCGRDGNLSVLAGDVVGKGPQAALTAAYLKGAYDCASSFGLDEPNLIARLDQQLSECMSSSTFATAVLVSSDLDRGEWVVARAGHPAPLLLRSDGTLLVLDAPGVLMGLFAPIPIEAQRWPMRPGDRIWIFSDGLLEEETPPRAVVSLMKLAVGLSPNESLAVLTRHLKQRARELHRNEDDCTAVLIQLDADWNGPSD